MHHIDLQLDITMQSYLSPPQRYNLNLFAGVNEPTIVRPTKSAPRESATILERSGDSRYDSSALLRSQPDSTFFGYWQSERYFQGIESILTERFVPRSMIFGTETTQIEQKIRNAGSASTFLCVRRYSYSGEPGYHGIMSSEYHQKALHEIHARTGIVPKVFIFSDEPEWCKENLVLPYSCELVGSYNQTTVEKLGREDIDLYLMSLCQHAVIANSTFPWWGAWLGDQRHIGQQRVVIGPKQWFANQDAQANSSDIIPDRWIKI